METNTYPLLPLRGINAFPNLTLHFDVGREKSVQALRAALEKEQNLFLTSQKDMEVSNPEEADLYSIGTMCKVQQVLALPGDHIRVLVFLGNILQAVIHFHEMIAFFDNIAARGKIALRGCRRSRPYAS